jgi:hypothetical protein
MEATPEQSDATQRHIEAMRAGQWLNVDDPIITALRDAGVTAIEHVAGVVKRPVEEYGGSFAGEMSTVRDPSLDRFRYFVGDTLVAEEELHPGATPGQIRADGLIHRAPS